MYTSGCPAIDQLIDQQNEAPNGSAFKWITRRTLRKTAGQTTTYTNTGTGDDVVIEMLLLGTRAECTQEFVHEFARIYSLPTHAYNNPSNIDRFKRYSTWLEG